MGQQVTQLHDRYMMMMMRMSEEGALVKSYGSRSDSPALNLLNHDAILKDGTSNKLFF
jgi:hypothetical protein